MAIAAIAVISLAGVALLWTLSSRHEALPPPNPVKALPPPDAYREALRLAHENRAAESLSYYRRALEGLAAESWEVEFNYGIALAANASRYTPRMGEPRPAARSSVVRVGLVREAMHQLDRAARIAPDAKTRAQVLGRLANTLAVWGLPWETLDLMRRAQYADTTDPEAATRAFLYMKMMRDPPLYAGDITVKQAIEISARTAPSGRHRRAP